MSFFDSLKKNNSNKNNDPIDRLADISTKIIYSVITSDEMSKYISNTEFIISTQEVQKAIFTHYLSYISNVTLSRYLPRNDKISFYNKCEEKYKEITFDEKAGNISFKCILLARLWVIEKEEIIKRIADDIKETGFTEEEYKLFSDSIDRIDVELRQAL